MADRAQTSSGTRGAEATISPSGAKDRWLRWHWIILAMLAVIEIAVSFHLALLNPVAGHDESRYLMNAAHLLGNDALPYQHHRPPLFPLILTLFGDYYRLVSALAHIACTVIVFLIGRRLFSPAVVIGTVVLFMVSAEMRYYNVLMLTELPSMLLLLLILLAFFARRPFITGTATMLLVANHWSMISIPSVVCLVYVIQRQWRALGWCLAGMALIVVPLCVSFTVLYGHPFGPIIARVTTTPVVENDLWYYWQQLPWMRLPLVLGGVAVLWWLVTTRGGRDRGWPRAFGLLIVGLIVARLAVLQTHVGKDVRFLAVLMPLFMLLSVLVLWQYRHKLGRWQLAAWLILFASLAPGKTFFWQLAGFSRHPVNQLVQLESDIEQRQESQRKEARLYTDLNCLVVTAHTKRLAVGVEHTGNRHWPFTGRILTTRNAIPEDALYLTWNPGNSKVLASVPPTGNDHGTLYLVCWHPG